jgi:hypothetical protein
MGAAAKSRFVIVFVMLLSLGVSLGLPAEDVLDSVYDESEALPCEGTPLFSIVLSPVAAHKAQEPLSALHGVPRIPSPFTLVSVRRAGTHRSTYARTSLALLCTLLC